MEPIKIIECPRDAMQGIKPFIPTEKKVAYIQSLLRVGFDSIDFGSFVSPKAIPQMQDTAEVLHILEPLRFEMGFELLQNIIRVLVGNQAEIHFGHGLCRQDGFHARFGIA